MIGVQKYESIKQKFRSNMWDQFDSVKRGFDGDDKKKFSIDLRGIEDNPSEGIEDDTIILSP